MKKRLIFLFFVVLSASVGTLVWYGQYRNRSAESYYSGTVEAVEANLAFQVSGKVKQVLVDEGQLVKKDQIVVELFAEEYEAQMRQAQANLNRANESLKQLESLLDIYRQTLPADVERAEAALNGFKAQLADAQAGYRDQEIESARLALKEAQIVMEEAQKDIRRLDKLYQEKAITEKERDAARLKFETSSKAYERAKESYDLIKSGYRKHTIEAAKAKVAEGYALAVQARGNLKKIEAAQRDIDVAKAQIQSAEAALELSEIYLSRTRLTAPFDGIVTSRNVEPGEVVTLGKEVLSIADLSKAELKIFVNETEIGKVRPGQKADIKTDTFPDKRYLGEVSYISPEAEFTPKIIQTHKERVKLVYLVKISVPNPNLELKPGMPADVWLR